MSIPFRVWFEFQVSRLNSDRFWLGLTTAVMSKSEAGLLITPPTSFDGFWCVVADRTDFSRLLLDFLVRLSSLFHSEHDLHASPEGSEGNKIDKFPL